MINSVIFIDLYYTMKNPFKPREARISEHCSFIAMVLSVCILITSTLMFIAAYISGGNFVDMIMEKMTLVFIQISFAFSFVMLFIFITVPVVLKIICRL